LPELFNVFDFANPHASTGMRPQTLVATQGLFMLNDGSVMAAQKPRPAIYLRRSPLPPKMTWSGAFRAVVQYDADG
jgi:hypothetical protein